MALPFCSLSSWLAFWSCSIALCLALIMPSSALYSPSPSGVLSLIFRFLWSFLPFWAGWGWVSPTYSWYPWQSYVEYPRCLLTALDQSLSVCSIKFSSCSLVHSLSSLRCASSRNFLSVLGAGRGGGPWNVIKSCCQTDFHCSHSFWWCCSSYWQVYFFSGHRCVLCISGPSALRRGH